MGPPVKPRRRPSKAIAVVGCCCDGNLATAEEGGAAVDADTCVTLAEEDDGVAREEDTDSEKEITEGEEEEAEGMELVSGGPP